LIQKVTCLPAGRQKNQVPANAPPPERPTHRSIHHYLFILSLVPGLRRAELLLRVMRSSRRRLLFRQWISLATGFSFGRKRGAGKFLFVEVVITYCQCFFEKQFC
jgi:hypothetical protein